MLYLFLCLKITQKVQNTTQTIQNEANNRRLTQLEDEEAQRRNAVRNKGSRRIIFAFVFRQ